MEQYATFSLRLRIIRHFPVWETSVWSQRLPSSDKARFAVWKEAICVGAIVMRRERLLIDQMTKGRFILPESLVFFLLQLS